MRPTRRQQQPKHLPSQAAVSEASGDDVGRLKTRLSLPRRRRHLPPQRLPPKLHQSQLEEGAMSKTDVERAMGKTRPRYKRPQRRLPRKVPARPLASQAKVKTDQRTRDGARGAAKTRKALRLPRCCGMDKRRTKETIRPLTRIRVAHLAAQLLVEVQSWGVGIWRQPSSTRPSSTPPMHHSFPNNFPPSGIFLPPSSPPSLLPTTSSPHLYTSNPTTCHRSRSNLLRRRSTISSRAGRVLNRTSGSRSLNRPTSNSSRSLRAEVATTAATPTTTVASKLAPTLPPWAEGEAAQEPRAGHPR
mmetsp:Transcript_68117/g.148580  ORF Transcript_68117/g.148580 Transcript_68117/m.148580 type:complete len:302 (-) Transcript_68117:903-1808(-)